MSVIRPRPRALELYCGIGGFAAAAGDDVRVVEALDISTLALSVYRANHVGHPAHALALDTVPRARLAAADADLWWLSPPCQPFTRRGLQRDDRDPRSRSLLALIDHLRALGPRIVALENVPGFATSRTHDLLCRALEDGGWGLAERLLCPTELGVPMRRQRAYLLAVRDARPAIARPTPAGTPQVGTPDVAARRLSTSSTRATTRIRRCAPTRPWRGATMAPSTWWRATTPRPAARASRRPTDARRYAAART